MEGSEGSILRVNWTALSLEGDGLLACSGHVHGRVHVERSIRRKVGELDVNVVVKRGCAALSLVEKRDLAVFDDQVAEGELLLRLRSASGG